jgi:serine/threonine protein kinase
MAKDKDRSPLSPNAPREFDSGPGKIREKVQKHTPKERDELLTANDLFGEIIDELREGGSENDVARGGAPASKAPASKAPARSRDKSSTKPTIRPDTVSVKPDSAEEPAEEHYSIVDLAYSTLLQDWKLNRQVDVLGGSKEEREKDDSAYGQYLLLDRIATGGMAEVFRAKRRGVEGFEKTVAVKRILPHLSDNKDFVEMFINEAKMVAGLSHPNIVQIFDLGKIEDTYYIAMEYIDGKDLRAILARSHDRDAILDVDLSALIATKIASALEYAHRHRDPSGRPLWIVHRDVSPPNVLISHEGEVKLVDFGIAKAAIKAPSTDSGSLRGKLLYMSPEQAWGRAMDKRSDIFSLGTVLFEMLTGRSLFMGTSEMSILERVRAAQFLTPSSFNPAIPIELEAVVAMALKKEPEDRYQDASEMLRDLDAYLRRRPAVGSTELARRVAKLFGSEEGENKKSKANGTR